MAINNPYVPGDPFSYDLKWIIKKLKEHGTILSTLDERIAAAVQVALSTSSPVYYRTAADLIASDALTPSLAYIEGFYEVGDLGANLYYVTDDYNYVLAADFYLTLTGANRWAIPIIVSPFVTPEMFGAKGDGVEDDSEAVKIAVKYANSIFTKTYLISEQIDCVSDTNITGTGTILDRVPQGTIQWEHPAVFRILNSKNVSITDLTFTGTGAYTDTTVENHVVIKAENSEEITLQGMKFYDINAGYGIVCKGSSRINISNNDMNRYTFMGIALAMGCDTVDISDNHLKNLMGVRAYNYPISITAQDAQHIISTNVTCCRNIIECPHPVWEGIDAHGGINIVIKDNIVSGCLVGIAAMEDPDWDMNNVVIEGNVISLGVDTTYGRSALNSGIVFNGNNGTIQNNVILNAGYTNEGIFSSGAALLCGNNITFTNNIINNVIGVVFWVRYGNQILIKDNQIMHWTWTAPSDSFNARPLFVNAYELLTGKLIIENNVINDAPTGSFLVQSSGSLGDNGGVIYCRNNDAPENARGAYTAVYVVCSPYTNAPIKVGMKGDIVWNIAPATGQPIGWICTTSYVNGAGGTWKALPNL